MDYFCPLLRKNCIGSKCAWHATVRGTDPNTGKEIDNPGCAVAFMPILLIENAKLQRSTAAATESFRNEMTKAHETDQQLLRAAANMIVTPLIQGVE
jgi:hypothetical protein